MHRVRSSGKEQDHAPGPIFGGGKASMSVPFSPPKIDAVAKSRPLALEVPLSRRERGRVRGDYWTFCGAIKV